ncbi:MAG: hypothetical protein ABIE84_07125, partial [bacterium]
MRFDIWKLVIICNLLLVSCILPTYALSGNDLIDKAKTYDGMTVEFVGEVVGDIMPRQEHVWLNVNDGQRAIGVWAAAKTVEKVKFAGDYTHTGDQLKIIGKFNRACSIHGGDLDIHAESITILKAGYKVEHQFSQWKIWLALLLGSWI